MVREQAQVSIWLFSLKSSTDALTTDVRLYKFLSDASIIHWNKHHYEFLAMYMKNIERITTDAISQEMSIMCLFQKGIRSSDM